MRISSYRWSAIGHALIASALLLAASPSPESYGKEHHSQATPILERIEWTDIWVTNADKDNLPRVLFVGDSITRGYFKDVEKELEGKANCARLATSAFISHEDFLGNLEILLRRYRWDVVHINNGLHGWDYTEEQYRQGFPALTSLLQSHAKGATIIWAMTTPLRERGNLEKKRKDSNVRVQKRNQIAAEFAQKKGYGTSDLFSLSLEHADHHRSDGTHFSAKGTAAQGKYIAVIVSKALKSRQNKTAGNGAKHNLKYTNDFESGAKDWQFIDAGCWKVAKSNGNQVLSLFKKKGAFEPKVRSLYHLALLKNNPVSDFQMDVRVRSTERDYNHRDACFIFGYQSPTRYYYIHLGKLTDQTAHQIHIVHDKDRSAITLKNNQGTPWDNQWHNVRIKRNAQSGRVAVYFDDMKTPTMTAKDKTFTWGRVGLGSFDDTVDFDDFKLSGQKASPASASEKSPSKSIDLPATVRPVAKDSNWWTNRQKKINERVKQGNIDLIFVGDSITQGWKKRGAKTWANYYTKRNAANLGISGDRTQHVLWRLQNGNLDGISPKLAVVMIGTNNAGRDAPEEIAQGVQAILKELQKRCPATKILLLDIFPRGEDDSDARRISNSKTNKRIAKFADNQRIFFLEIGNEFLNQEHVLARRIMPDLLHPNVTGYKIWAESIEAKVQELMGEKQDPDAALRKKNGFRELANSDPKLPNVLVVGDSICSGYNDEVRKMLAGKANVYTWVTGMNIRRGNIEDTQRAALAAADFDVVHFNIGLHGLGNRIPREMYEPLLRKYVANFEKHAGGAHLIWGSTTPIWDNKTNTLSPGNAKIVKRNAIAAKVMKDHSIPITKLYAAVVDKLELGSGIHWSDAGYRIMAEAITKNIEIALKKPRKQSAKQSSSAHGEAETSKSPSATAKDSELPQTVQPVPKNGRGWRNRNKAMNARVKEGKVDLIFVGDSITHFWDRKDKGLPTWEKYYAKRNAVNLGISADRTQHVLWRLQNGNLEGISPKAAVLMIGTNNAGSNSSKEIAAGVKAIVDTIEEKCPSTHVLILGIFPRGKDDTDRRRIVNRNANKIISTFADNRTIFYMDIGEKLLEKDRTLSQDIMPDRLHPNAKGYQIWAEVIEDKLKELLDE